MEVKQTVKAGAEEFFDALAQSVAYDISQATGKTVNPDQIYPGCRYKKVMKNKVGQKGDVEVTIKRFTRPSKYEASFCSSQGTNYITYEIEDLKNGTIMVHYREGFEGESASSNLNFKLTSLLYNYSGKKRMIRTLKAMEQYLQSQKQKES